jgi:hypothetical protein
MRIGLLLVSAMRRHSTGEPIPAPMALGAFDPTHELTDRTGGRFHEADYPGIKH